MEFPQRNDLRLSRGGSRAVVALQRAVDGSSELVDAKRLAQQDRLIELVVEAGGIGIPGYHDDRQLRPFGARGTRQFGPRHPRHRVIRHQQIDIGVIAGQQLDRLMPACGLQRPIAERVEIREDHVSHILVVVHDEDPRPPRQALVTGCLGLFG